MQVPKKVSTRKLQEFNQKLQEAISLLMGAVQEELGDKPWTFCVLDIRWYPDSSRKSKTRVHLPKAGQLHFMHTPIEVLYLLDDAWALMDKAFSDKWYGLKITVYPEGKAETEFNYDPKCLSDPTFFED
jgi:hypothetical protein